LIARILFLEGIPVVINLKKITIGADIEAQFRNDLAAEYGAVKGYNDAVRLAYELNDNGSREMLDSILTDEEDHVDWLEAQNDQVRMMGIQAYLVEQVG
jgi:bacterioferritin